jgi:arylsulfatase A-like enzyme/Flp pilus assembly protein TadD
MHARAAAFALLLVGSLPRLLSAEGTVLVTIDTLRADRVHALGYTAPITPELDRLAAEGFLFSQATASAPLTLPSHTAIMTGLLPPRTGVDDYTSWLRPDVGLTLAELFRQAGYITAAFVSAPVLAGHFGLRRGFELYDDNLAPYRASAYKRPADQTVGRALAWLRTNREKRFFLWIHLYDPHLPYRPPESFLQQFSNSGYDAEIAFADHELGRLFGYLRAAGRFQSTTIAVVADHGEALGEHGEPTHGFFVYNSTLRVPLIIKPAIGVPTTQGPRRSDARLQSVDLYPTLLRLAGIQSPSVCDGELLPIFGDSRPITNAARRLYSEIALPRVHYGWSDLKAITVDRFKYILAPKPELYDLQADPGETRNLILERSTLAARLRNELLKLHADLSTWTAKPTTKAGAFTLDPRTVAALQALGYASGPVWSPGPSSLELPDPKDKLAVYDLINEAIRAQAQRHPSMAIAALLRAKELDSDCPAIHTLLGMALLSVPGSSSNYRDAADEFRKVLNQAPNETGAIHGLATAYMKLGDYRAAEGGLEQVVRLKPTDARATFDLGVVRQLVGDARGALRAYGASVRIDPNNPQAWTAIGELDFGLNRVTQAERALRQAIRTRPDYIPAHQVLARVYAARGKATLSEAEDRRAAQLVNGLAEGLKQEGSWISR